jgi:hypothetical protein
MHIAGVEAERISVEEGQAVVDLVEMLVEMSAKIWSIMR